MTEDVTYSLRAHYNWPHHFSGAHYNFWSSRLLVFPRKGWRKKERERERAQINVDAKRSSSSNLPKRRRYCTLPCFQGYYSLSLSLKFLYKHALTTCLVQRCKSSTKEKKNMNSVTQTDTNLLQSSEPFISSLSIIFGSKWLILLFGFFFFAVCHITCHPNVYLN